MAGVLGAPAFAFAAYRRRATERSAIVRSSYTVTKTLSNSPLWVSLGFAPWSLFWDASDTRCAADKGF